MSGVLFNYSDMVRIQIGLFADDALRSIFLAKLKINGDLVDVSSKQAVDSFSASHVGVAKAFRALELISDRNGAQVNPEVVKALAGDGLTTLEMLHRLLGRCEYRQGLYWFHFTEEVMTPFDIIANYPAKTAGPCPQVIDHVLDQWLTAKLQEAGDRSWTMASWLPCDNGSDYSLKVSKHNGAMHAEVMKEDILGNFGLGSSAFQSTDAIRRAMARAADRADADMDTHRVFAHYIVYHNESKSVQRFLRRLDTEAELPTGFTEGWQHSETPLSKENQGQAETFIAGAHAGTLRSGTNVYSDLLIVETDPP